ncbi:MAG: T9SS type A sorting domain-containing protein, partial [Bacteroidota bacterium]
VVTLNLTINNSTTGTDVITACDSYTWIDGVTYTASNNSATFTLTNAIGCDSLVTLNLTINNSNTGTDVVTACSSYTWIDGVTYTADNSTATFVLTNAAGCDSTVTLNLTLLNNTGTDVVTACETYTWIDGVTYTASNNTATFTLTNAAGCDSLVTLNLTINNSTTSTTTVAECGSYTWTDGVTYTTSGIYTQLLTNAAGCDSTAVLELTINPFPVATATDNGDGTITASSGASYQWINCATGQPLNNETAQTFVPSVNGSYQVVVTNASGCADTSDCVVIDYIGLDEIVKTDISVYPNPTRDNVYVSMTAETAVFEVIDGQGKVLQTSVISNNGQIDLSSYTPGVYVIRINTGNESSIHRVVKN